MSVYIQDLYTWSATYRDGTMLAEYDSENTIGRGFAEVEPALVKTLHLISTQDRLSHAVAIPEGATPVFFRRRKLILNPVEEEYAHAGGASCIGWKHGEQEVYLFVLDDGSTLLTSDLQAV